MSGTRVPLCAGCGRRHHLLRRGLCPACERERAAGEAREAEEAARGRAVPPDGALSDPLPPEDLFGEDE